VHLFAAVIVASPATWPWLERSQDERVWIVSFVLGSLLGGLFAGLLLRRSGGKTTWPMALGGSLLASVVQVVLLHSRIFFPEGDFDLHSDDFREFILQFYVALVIGLTLSCAVLMKLTSYLVSRRRTESPPATKPPRVQ
jgi:hypothetical protein